MPERTVLTCGICAKFIQSTGRSYGVCLGKVPELLVHRGVLTFSTVPSACRFADKCYKFSRK